MQIKRWWVWVLCANCCGASCMADDEVWLGHAGWFRPSGGNSAHDSGTAPMDVPILTPSWPRPMSLVEVAVPGRCDVPVTGQLSRDLKVSDIGPRADLGVTQLAPLADQTIWILASTGLPTPTLRLAHVDADGQLLGSANVALSAQTFTSRESFVVDDHGVAWLLAGVDRLQRYDASVAASGAPIQAPAGASGIASVPGRGVVIASADDQYVTTLLDYEGNELWSRRIGSNSAGGQTVVADASSITLLHVVSREPSYGGIAAQRYDLEGNPGRNFESSVNLFTGGFPNYLRYGMDVDSNLILAMTPPGADGYDLPGVVDVESIDSNAARRWALRLRSSLNPTLAFAPDGSLWVAERENFAEQHPDDNALPSSSLARISQDGTSCQRYAYASALPMLGLETAPDGRLWFATSPDYAGRFAPLTP